MKIKALLLSLILVVSMPANAGLITKAVGFVWKSFDDTAIKTVGFSDNITAKTGRSLDGLNTRIKHYYDDLGPYEGQGSGVLFHRAFVKIECNLLKNSLNQERGFNLKILDDVYSDARKDNVEAMILLGDVSHNYVWSCQGSRDLTPTRLLNKAIDATWYKEAYLAGDSNPVASYKLGKYYQSLGRKEEAKKWFNRFKERESSYESAKSAYLTYSEKFYRGLNNKNRGGSNDRSLLKSKFNINNLLKPSFIKKE